MVCGQAARTTDYTIEAVEGAIGKIQRTRSTGGRGSVRGPVVAQPRADVALGRPAAINRESFREKQAACVGDGDYQRSIDGLIGRSDVSLWASGEGALRVVTQRWPLCCGDSLDPLNGPVGILRDVPHGAPFTARRNSSSLRGVNRQLAGSKSFTHRERCHCAAAVCESFATPCPRPPLRKV